MPLTKDDLHQIENIVSTKVDELAEITAHGFGEVHKILNEHGKILNEHGKILNEHSQMFKEIKEDISEIRSELRIIRRDIEILTNRVDQVALASRQDTDVLYTEIEKLKKRIKALEIKVVSPAKA
ncbi:hypothetical protein COS66_00580 [Candidatus Berkelbacteria bacterium CG06_land_8_20_14_3_00_43_10]|nr:MAG: hypothetical protein AUK41_03310 [Candidatus Berkelbacteria bacterium CG2_30_43_20]PIU87484.1 MAG: hypothetical protein COS66_00580 [Candidatus Berkelbacteria bacterium CG06_land_8_20_14_3_00_43_10]